MATTIEYLRSHRVMGFAVFDLVGAHVLMYVLALTIRPDRRMQWLYATIPAGILVHYLFGVNTRLNVLLGLQQ